jgi:membrane protease YdiL (CAAX protease family)
VLAALLGVTLFIPQIASALRLPYHVTNPVLYVVIPAAALVLGFGVSPRGLGIRPGYRAWAVAALWIGVQALFVVVQLALGHFTPAWVANRLLGNVLQNGFAEEFLWRGVIQTRLAGWLTPTWGAVLAALLFGVWHLRANLSMLDGDWLAALAFCIVSQARYGLMMAVLFLRTRSLLAPGLAHTFANLNPLNFL